MRRSVLTLLATSTLVAWPAAAFTRIHGGVHLVRETRPLGPITPPTTGPHPGSHGSTLIADAYGLLVAERSVGAVIRCDGDGAPQARVQLHPGLGELVSDGDRLAFVAAGERDQADAIAEVRRELRSHREWLRDLNTHAPADAARDAEAQLHRAERELDDLFARIDQNSEA